MPPVDSSSTEVIRPALESRPDRRLCAIRRFDAGLPGLRCGRAARPAPGAGSRRHRRTRARPDRSSSTCPSEAGLGAQGAGRGHPLRRPSSISPSIDACATASWRLLRRSRSASRSSMRHARLDDGGDGCRRRCRRLTVRRVNRNPWPHALPDEHPNTSRGRSVTSSPVDEADRAVAGSHRRRGARRSRRTVRPIQDDGLLDRLPHHE